MHPKKFSIIIIQNLNQLYLYSDFDILPCLIILQVQGKYKMGMVQMENDTTELKWFRLQKKKMMYDYLYINEQGLLLIRDGTYIDTIF